MAIYKSAMGKPVDMAALVAKNTSTRAVGNMKNVNARGDTIDSDGNIVKLANEKVNEQYAKTVGSRSAQIRPADRQPAPVGKPQVSAALAPPPPPNIIPHDELTDMEKELESSSEEDEVIEKIKQAEVTNKRGKK
jgi:hypothetical protein